MGSAKWWGVTSWYIDPAQTHGGSDENDGLTSSTPIKSIAEWRRRINGAVFTGNGPVIHAMSGSTNSDDGFFYGFTTQGPTTYVKLAGTPVATGLSGTVASYQAYSGNTRGQFTDSALPVSWTASGGISLATGSRFVRKVGSGLRHYAPLIKDLTAKSAQFGIVVDWDETDTTNLRTAETNFANSDAYEVVSMPTWPAPRAMTGNVHLQCFDIQAADMASVTGNLRFVLCGFPQPVFPATLRACRLYSSVMCMTSPDGFSPTGSTVIPINSAMCNSAILEASFGALNWHGQTNVVAGAELRFWHGMNVGSLGNMRCFDNALPLVSVRHDSTAKLDGTIVGSGNSGALVNCDTAGIFYGASTITATTSAAHPYTINGVGHDSPAIETTGDAVYG